MAKRKQEFDLDEFGFDANLDIPDFDFNSTEIKDDRSAVTKVASGVKDGIKETVMSPSFMRKLIRNSLPEGYGSAMSMIDETAATVGNLYNDAAKEAKPVIKDMKRVTKRLLPTVEGVLPKKMAEKLKKWSENDPDKVSGGMSAEQMREASLQAQLGDIFKFQSEQQQQDKAEDEVRQSIRDSVEHDRHRDMFGQLDAMRISLQQLAGYQEKVDAAYKRKSLELQFRHYFVAVDQLEEQKKFNADARTNLEAIMKNTALPDFVKLKNSERLHEVLRNKFIDGLNDSVFTRRRQMIGKIGKNLSQQAMERFRGFLDNFKDGISAADGLADLQEMQRDMQEMGGGPSREEMGGQIIGGVAAETLGGRAGKAIRNGINKYDTEGHVDRFGNRLQHITENAPQMLVDYANSDKHEYGAFGGVARLFKDAIFGANREDTNVASDSMRSMQDPVPYNRAAQKSLTEIIPGYLARMLRELQITRTGDEKIQLTSFDFMSNKFVEKTSLKNSIFRSIVKEQDQVQSKSQIDEILKEVDPDGTKLKPEQRKALGEWLLENNLQNKSSTAKRLKDFDSYSGAHGRYAGVFSDLFTDYFEDDERGVKNLRFSRLHNRLGSGISDARAIIQDHINTGNRDVLEELGILKPGSDAIDMRRLRQYFSGDNATISPDAPQRPNERRRSPTMGPNPRRRQGPPAPPQPAPQPTPTPTPVPTPTPAPVIFEVTELIQAIKNSASETITAIKENTSKPESLTINETLLRIEEKIKQGVTINFGGAGEGGRADMGGNGGGPRPRWWNRSIGELTGDIAGAGVRGVNRLREAGANMFSRGASATMGAFRGLRDYAKATFNDLQRAADVYIEGEIMPRLQKAKMEAGLYRDQVTGNVIRTLEDIKGAVIDEDGNVVLTMEEAKKAFAKSTMGAKIIKLGVKTTKKATDLVSRGLKALPGIYGKALGAGLDAAKKAMNLVGARDVYIAGKEEPVLLARVMRAGGYRSKATGEVIYKVSHIKGAVIDENDEVVLSTEEFKQGLLDKDGNPLKTGVARMAQHIGNIVGKGVKFAGGLFEAGSAMFKGGLKGLGNLFEKGGIFFGGGKTVVDRLTEIRDLLEQRLPERKKRVVGDLDGDGVRDGSNEDLAKDAKEKLLAQTGNGKEEKGGFGKLLGAGGIKGLIDKLRGKKDEEEEEEEDEDSFLEDVATEAAGDALGDRLGGGDDREERRGRRGRRGRRRNRRGNPRQGPRPTGGRSLLGRVGGAAVKGLGVAGAAYGGYSAYQNFQEGNYGEAALDAGMAGMGAITAVGGLSAAGGAISGALSVGGSLLAGAAGLISAPLVLGALAVGGLGYLAYKAYTRKTLDTWSKIRYAQYGFLPTDTDHVQAVLELEDELAKGIVYDNGVARLEEKKIDFKSVVKKFGVDLADPTHTKQWLSWFINRFKPVYLVHMTALNKVAPGKKLDDIASLKPEQRKQYLEIAKFPSGPYNHTVSPFKDLKSLQAGADNVKALAEAAELENQKGLDNKPDATGMAAGAGVAAAGAVKVGMVGKQNTASAAGRTTTTARTADGAAPDQGGWKSTYSPAMAAAMAGMRGPIAGPVNTDSRFMVSVSGIALGHDQFANGKVDALPVVRYKTYGLKEMAVDKLRALDTLEKYVMKDVQWGKGNVAKWEGSIQKVLSAIGPSFGIEAGTSDASTAWMSWFVNRFLPVYTNYLTAVAQATGKTDMAQGYVALKPQQMVDVAIAIYTSKGSYGGNTVSAWQVPSSPWENYELNSDVKSVELNVNGLKEAAKRVVLEEQTGKTPKGQDAQANPQEANTFLGKTKNLLSNVMGNVAGAVSGITGMFGGPKSDASLDTKGGRDIVQPGGGTGGDINSIPKPTGNKTWAALKDTIVAAAKMVGVDEKLMATMAAIESGFDYTVKAKTSSASGLYQFIDSTWKWMLKRFGGKYGIDPNTPQTDPRANALMGAEYMKESIASLKTGVSRGITDTDVYMAHFLGPGGAKKFLNLNPNAIAANEMPKEARANASIFYDNGRPRTVAEVYALMNKKVRNGGKAFGVDLGSEAVQTTSSTKAPAGEVPAAAGNKPTTGGSPTVAAAGAAANAAPSATTAPQTTSNATPAGGKTTTTARTVDGAAPDQGGWKSPYSPAMTAAMTGKLIPNALAVPVANQTPTVTSKQAAPVQATQPQKAASQAQPMSADIMAMGAGFLAGPSRDAQAQTKYQRELRDETLGNLNDVASKSLEVQKEQLTVIKSIRDLVLASAQARADQKAQQPAKATPTAPAPVRAPQAVQRAPVSMSKDA